MTVGSSASKLPAATSPCGLTAIPFTSKLGGNRFSRLEVPLSPGTLQRIASERTTRITGRQLGSRIRILRQPHFFGYYAPCYRNCSSRVLSQRRVRRRDQESFLDLVHSETSRNHSFPRLPGCQKIC